MYVYLHLEANPLSLSAGCMGKIVLKMKEFYPCGGYPALRIAAGADRQRVNLHCPYLESCMDDPAMIPGRIQTPQLTHDSLLTVQAP